MATSPRLQIGRPAASQAPRAHPARPRSAPGRDRGSPSTSVAGAAGEWDQRPASASRNCLPMIISPLHHRCHDAHTRPLTRRCVSLSFNAQWYEAFGVLLCNQCKSTEQLISKVPLAPGAAALVLALYEARPLLGTPDALPGQERPRVIKIPPSHTIIKQSPTKKKKNCHTATPYGRRHQAASNMQQQPPHLDPTSGRRRQPRSSLQRQTPTSGSWGP